MVGIIATSMSDRHLMILLGGFVALLLSRDRKARRSAEPYQQHKIPNYGFLPVGERHVLLLDHNGNIDPFPFQALSFFIFKTCEDYFRANM